MTTELTTELTTHLDIGCGGNPRNPYQADQLFGLDQSDLFSAQGVRPCKLGLEPIPFESDHFDSVSAFDVLEHIPRQAYDYRENTVFFPFISLMNEIWRVLKPGGKFFALTPAYPAKQAFQDPTHVNFITDDTHSYFCDPENGLLRYGFKGAFRAIKVRRVMPEEVYRASISLRLKWKRFRYHHFKGGITHLLWELEAIKPENRKTGVDRLSASPTT